MKFTFSDLTLPASLPKSGSLVLPVLAERTLTPAGTDLDGKTGGMLTRAMAANKFSGKTDELLTVVAPGGVDLNHIVLVGLGKPDQITDLTLQDAGGAIVAALGKNADEVTVVVDELGGGMAPATVAAEIAFGAQLRSYRFDKYRTKEKPEAKPSLQAITLLTSDAEGAASVYAAREAVADGVFLTRDVISEPANILYPRTLADRCVELGSLGVEVQVLDQDQMASLGMGALLGVAMGSVKEPYLVVMKYDGAPDAEDKRPVAFVGKGVTFDTGGISIKPAGGMEDMKWDMGGAGVVLGLMKALAGRKAKVNAVGIVGLVENMPSGSAQRPGDIVTSMSGQTIEVLNTDAEGRLVLADALWFTQDTFKPRAMVNLATLTGAIIVALGTEHAGLFSNDDALSEQLTAAGRKVGEKLWRMPMNDAYDKAINSDAADVKNIAGSRDAGSIIGAQFLQRFVNNVPWAHLDIAGVTWSKKDTGTIPKGATSFGVRLLDRYVADVYES
jgi:leucyl aminopeptidase